MRQAFPLSPDLAETNRANLELLAQSAEEPRLFAAALFVELARDPVASLSLYRVIDEIVLAMTGPCPAEGLGVDSCPEQGEIADVPVVFPSSAATGR